MRSPKSTTVSATLGAGALIAGGLVAASMTADGANAHQAAPGPNPANFNNPQQNPYFPVKPGTVSRYRGTDGGTHYHEKLTVTHKTKMIQGVRTTVILDVSRRTDGSLAEKTHDWYADDNDGNVWYFGERTATYDRQGNVDSREGSWQSGVQGAVAGIIMPADPRPTDAYRQEFDRGHAEDQAWIVQRGVKATVPYGQVDHAVRSFEWTRLERDVLSMKLYAPGLGIVLEKDVAGGNERFELVSVHHR